MASRTNRGFTLIEMMTVVGIIGVLAALATVGMTYGMGRARLNNAAFEVSALFSVAQLRATGTGIPHYVVFWQDGTDFGVYLLERKDPAPTWATVNVRDFAVVTGGSKTTGQVVEQIKLSSTGGVQLYPLVGLVPGGFKAPFKSVPSTGTGGSKLQEACSFCVAAAVPRGVVRFGPDGLMSMETGTPTAPGGSIALAANKTGEMARPKVLALAAPSGVVKVFQGKQ